MYGSCGSLWLYVRAVFAVAAAVGGCFDCLLLQGPTFFCLFGLAICMSALLLLPWLVGWLLCALCECCWWCCVCCRSPGSGRGAAAERGGPQRQRRRRWVDSSDVGSSTRFVFCRCGVCVCVCFRNVLRCCTRGRACGAGRVDLPVCIRICRGGWGACWVEWSQWLLVFDWEGGSLCMELCVFVVVCAGGVGCCSSGWGLF